MKIQLIDYTGKGMHRRYPAELLAFTKSTRLKMDTDLLDTVKGWSDTKLNEELLYMSNTIPSSWEFVEYTFLLTDCTRAFTHQLVRNRHGSYAQQTIRILDVSGFGYEIGPSIEGSQDLLEKYCDLMEIINSEYKELIENGAAIEDARGVLPTNIHTNIICKFNLRTLAELVSKRSSTRTQGEYRTFVEGIADTIIATHPWVEVFLRNKKHDAAEMLEDFIARVFDESGKSLKHDMNDLIKMVDILRG